MIDVEQFAGLSIPERLALYVPVHPEAVKLLRGNREVCSNSTKGKREYRNRRDFLYQVYDGLCCLCGHHIPEGQETLEHPAGRGTNGNKRDDSVKVCLLACWSCQGRKGSRPVAIGESCPYCEWAVVIGSPKSLQKAKERECLRCNGKWTSEPLR